MSNKTVSGYVSEIRSLENQVSEISKEQEKIKKDLSIENSTFEQSQEEQKNLLQEIKAKGFFNFKEKKPLQLRLKEIRTKIKQTDEILIGLKEKDAGLSEQVSDLQNKIKSAQHEKEMQEKEEKRETLANQGDAQAQYEMALKYSRSEFKDALRWLRKAAVQGHQEAQRLKDQIENEEIYFGLCNNSAWDIVKISVYHDSINTHNWQGRLLSTMNGGRYEPVLCSFTKGTCNPDYNGWIPIKVEYVVNINGNLVPAVKEESIQYPSLKDSPESADKIYLDFKIS